MLRGIGNYLWQGVKGLGTNVDGLLQQIGVRKPPVEVVHAEPHMADGAHEDGEFVVSALTLGEEDVGAFIRAGLQQVTTGANLAVVLEEGVNSLLRRQSDPPVRAALANMPLANLQRLSALGIAPPDRERVAEVLVRLATVGNPGAVDILLDLSRAGQPLGDRTAMVKDLLVQASMASPLNPHLLRCLCGLAEMKFHEPSHLFGGEDPQLQKVVSCRDLLIALKGSLAEPMVRDTVSRLDLREINDIAGTKESILMVHAQTAGQLLAMHRDFLRPDRR